MSYILEGLKKLERNRQRADASGLFTTYNNQTPGRSKKKWWPYFAALAGILIVINGAGLYWWMSEKPSSKTFTSTEQTQDSVSAPDVQQAAGDPHLAAVKEEQTPLDPPLLEKPQDLYAAAADKPAKKSSRKKAGSGEESDPELAGVEEVQPVRTGEKVLTFNQLPDDVKKSLPEIKVFMHFYSPAPKERFIQINEHTLRQGQSRPDGLKVLQINQHAAIFDYQGHRFQIRAIEK